MTRRGEWHEPVIGAGMRRAVLQGQNMVMPTEVIAADYDGETLLLDPTRDFLSVDHPLVTARPDCFTPALGPKLDAATHERMADLTRAAGGAPANMSTRTSSTRISRADKPAPDTSGGLRLPTGPAPRLRLPT